MSTAFFEAGADEEAGRFFFLPTAVVDAPPRFPEANPVGTDLFLADCTRMGFLEDNRETLFRTCFFPRVN